MPTIRENEAMARHVLTAFNAIVKALNTPRTDGSWPQSKMSGAADRLAVAVEDLGFRLTFPRGFAGDAALVDGEGLLLPDAGDRSPDDEGRPRSFAYGGSRDEWAAFIAAMRGGGTVEIDESMFYYWMECLPPVFMDRVVDGRRYAFGFSEGAEPIIGFWRAGGQFYCARTSLVNGGV